MQCSAVQHTALRSASATANTYMLDCCRLVLPICVGAGTWSLCYCC